MMIIIRVLFTLFLLLFSSLSFSDPLKYYNLYRNTPRVNLIADRIDIHSLKEHDTQYKTVSNLDNDFIITGSTFYEPLKSSFERIKPSGSIKRTFPKLDKINYFKLKFKKKGLNRINITFKTPIKIPLWAESFEFWSHGYGKSHKYRLVYIDSDKREYSVDLRVKKYYGWKRFSANIELRSNKKLSFAGRYRQIWLKQLIILDDLSTKKKYSIYHIAKIGVSRIRRNLINKNEQWRYRPIFNFNSRDNLTFKFFSYTNGQAIIKQKQNKIFLQLKADPIKQGFKRVIIRFGKNPHLNLSRYLIFHLKGDGAGERVYFLLRNINNKYFLIGTENIYYTGWKKLYLRIPRWVKQKRYTLINKTGFELLQIMIEPKKNDTRKKIDLALDNLGIVEDISDKFFMGIEMKNSWDK